MKQPDSIPHSGTWLDIGCANGYLIECTLRWTAARGLAITPYGLDFSAALLALAQARLPTYADHFFLGNAWDWSPPHRFDCVSTNLEYVPDVLKIAYVQRLLRDCIVPRGTLLIGEYTNERDPRSTLAIDTEVVAMGFPVATSRSGYLHGKELARVATVPSTLESSNDPC